MSELVATLAEHRLNTPVQCICGWRETDGNPDMSQVPSRDRWAAHVAAALAPVIAEQVAAGAAKALEDAALRVEAAYTEWAALGDDHGPWPLHSEGWLIERAFSLAASAVRAGGRP